jgi:hypothetical protein
MSNNQIFRLLLFFGLILISNVLTAQYYTYGQDPASQRWRQLKTDHFRLIYPESWENQAQKQAQFLETLRAPMSRSLGSNPKPIPVILRNQTMLSNGFVMWAPKRIELVTTIPFDNQAVNWMKYLSIHEYRHVVQVEAVNTSTTRFFSKIFGEHITGSVVGLHLPLWFLEGDAVLAETSFTRSGRGRLPTFKMPLTTQVLEQGAYSFDKATLGSYRDIVPDHYTLGYHLVAAIQSKHGFEPFRAAIRQVARTPFFPGSFARGIRKVTGKGLSQNYKTIISELETEWKENFNNSAVSDYLVIEANNNFDYVDYINPQYIDEDYIIAFRTSPADIPRLLKIGRDGSEEILFTPGFGYYISMSYSKGLAAWLEINPDPRWAYRNWTNIRVLNIESGKSRLITSRARMQAPMLSPDGSMIVSVELDETNRWALVIFDTSNGTELYRITDESIDFIMEPEWSDCQTFLIAIAFVEGKGKSIVRTGIQNPEFEHLFYSGFNDISEPAIHDSVIYFTGTWSGRDAIYAWDLNEKLLRKVLSSPFGATCANVSEDGLKILFSDYTSYGYQIGEYLIGNPRIAEISGIQALSTPLYENAANDNKLLLDTIVLTDTRFESQPFAKLHNSVIFHSWLPASLDVDGLNIHPGITFLSQDILGSKELLIGYEHNINRYGRVAYLDYSMKSLYPVINFRFDIGSEDRYYRDEENDVVTRRTSFGRIRAGIGLPLSYSRHAIIFGFNPQISTSLEQFSNNDGVYREGRLRAVSYSISAYAYRRMAYRDLFPKYGISLITGFNHTPFRSIKEVRAGHIVYGAVVLYLPGFSRHHSFRAYAGSQEKNIERAAFNDGIRMARGYNLVRNDKMSTLSLAYSQPVWYPDIAIGSVVYAKRLKSNFFYDISRVSHWNVQTNFVSYGLDLLFDVHLFRMPMPFEVGIRSMYLDNTSTMTFQFLWGVNFYDVGQKLNGRSRMLPTY